jgi:putative transposase
VRAGQAGPLYPERAWPGAVSPVVLQQALADLNAAYRNIFASVAAGGARFKVLASGKLRLPKIGDVAVRWSRPPPSEPSWIAGRSWRRRQAGRAARRTWRSRR